MNHWRDTLDRYDASLVEDTAGEYYVDATPEDVCALFQAQPDRLGVDTEGWVNNPWSIQISAFPGSALVMRTPEAIAAFAFCYDEANPKPTLVFHPALHELPMLSAMGITVPDDGFDDTSLKAHLLDIQPPGAKNLFLRFAGMDQASYTEVMSEASERLAFDFLFKIVSTWPRDPKPKPHWLERTLRQIDSMLVKERTVILLRARWNTSTAKERLEDAGLIGRMPEPVLDDIPLARAIHYAGRDADGTLRINAPLDAQIDALGLRGALNADLEAVPMLNRMQTVGMGVDEAFFPAYGEELGMELAIEQGKLDAMVGHPLNVNSTVAVPAYLFETLKLPIRKRTDGGQGSTNDKILDAMRLDPITPTTAQKVIHQIQEVREIRKIKTSFADALPQFVRAGRVHPRFRLLSTGRLGCSDPNLLAFPKHSARGLRIREGFVAGKERLLGSLDLSQIEMRVFAIDCEDENMLAQFRSGFDFHTAGAAAKLGKRPEDITKEERFVQKAINFGILMGITEYGLLDQFAKAGIFVSLDDCRRFLVEWFRQYPAAQPYISEKHAEARRLGYVRDMWGRLRYLPDITSGNTYLRKAAERQAQATPTQSGAQGLMKRFMKKVWDRMVYTRTHEGWHWEPLLQVHDDLITEFDAEWQPRVEYLMAEALADMQWFPIPITTGEPTAGERWSDL